MIRVGVVGLGMAAAPHVHSLRDLGDRVTVAGVFSLSAKRRTAFAATHGFPAADSLDALLTDPSVAALIVLTPTATHLDLVRRAADAGKHVLLEKPLETTLARSQELVETAERAGIRLGIVLQNRFRQTVEEVDNAVREGSLGAIVSVSVRLNNWRPQSYYDQPGRGTLARDGGGVLLTQGIHTLDQMVALVGLPEEVVGYAVTSQAHRMETEDVAHAAMRFAGGALGAISATTAAYPGFEDGIDIFGTEGSARMNSTGALLCFLDGTERRVTDGTAGNGVGADPMAFSPENHRRVLEDFIAAITEHRDPRVTGREALKVHRLISAILDASTTGTAVRLD